MDPLPTPRSDSDRPEDEERLWGGILAAARGATAGAALRASPLWRIYGPLIEGAGAGRPYVIGQMGQSLDGRIATRNGVSRTINGPSAMIHLHRLRALVDAVVVGVGTAVIDDPQLTVRLVSGRHPARIVIDPSGRLPAGARCLGDDGVRRIVVQSADHRRPDGVETLRLPATGGVIDPMALRQALAGMGLRRVLVEGGGVTVSQFLNRGCLDRLHVLVAPMIIGSGLVGIGLDEIGDLERALRPPVAVTPFPEGDVLFDCDLGGGG